MSSYVVMLPPRGSPEQRLEQALSIRDGFSWPGLLVPPLWLAWHRLWLEAILAFLAVAAFSGLAEAWGTGPAGALPGLLVSLYVGLEGQAMRIAALRRRGWQDAGVVEADRSETADLRYLIDAAARLPAEAAPASMRIEPAAGTAAGTAAPAATLGLVSYSRRP